MSKTQVSRETDWWSVQLQLAIASLASGLRNVICLHIVMVSSICDCIDVHKWNSIFTVQSYFFLRSSEFQNHVGIFFPPNDVGKYIISSMITIQFVIIPSLVWLLPIICLFARHFKRSINESNQLVINIGDNTMYVPIWSICKPYSQAQRVVHLKQLNSWNDCLSCPYKCNVWERYCGCF